MESGMCTWTLLMCVWCLMILETRGLDFATRIGCTKNNELHNQFSSNDVLVLREKLTPEICVNHCKSKGFKYAIIQSSFNCSCSHSRPEFDVSSYISESYFTYDGNMNEICRGPDSINVYKIYDELYDDLNYIGCFLDGGTRERIFATKKIIKQKFVSPEACIEFCYKKGYKYAGITYRFLCSCDNQLGTKKNEKLCSKFSGDTSLLGVAKMYMRLYHTNLPS